MDRLEPERHLERPVEKIAEPQGRIAAQGGVGLDDHPLEAGQESRDRTVIFPRDRLPVEEAPGVVELGPPRRRQMRERRPDLLGNRPGRNRFRQGVAPEIAHQAAPGAFAIREEDCRDPDHLAGRRALPFKQKAVRLEGIELVSRWPAR